MERHQINGTKSKNDLFYEITGVKFSSEHLLIRALTHRSYLNEHPDSLEDNERLEFLGDAVLDFLVGAWLYNHFPEMAEGELTKMRSALVRTEQLAEFAHAIKLGEMVLLGRGEVENGGRMRLLLLCATFEAIIGALYLEKGITVVQEFIEPFLQEAAEQIIVARKERDPKSVLQEWVQAQGLGPPVYKVISAIGPDHQKTFEVEVWVGDRVYGRGLGSSKRFATKVAAQAALDQLGIV